MAIQVTRTRTRAPATAAAPAASAPAAPPRAAAVSWMKTGSAARQLAETEVQRQREAAERRASGLFMPFRFRQQVGETRTIVILDDQPGPCFYEHQLQNPRNGKWDTFETCPKEWEPCPICDGAAGGKESYYVMMLTCMDLTPYVNKKGEQVPFSRRLLPVKANQQQFFLRQLDRHGSLRGLELLMARDTQQTSSIGNPEFQTQHAEADILAAFGHEAVVGQDGKVIKPKNADCFPYPYDKLFKRPSAEDLRRRYGGMAPAGSRQETADAWADDADGEGTESADGTVADAVPMD